MSKALSIDLRVRVLAAAAAGASHRQAAERFGVSPASVSVWRMREREQGDPRPKALGPQRDPTIEEIRSALAAQGLFFGFGAIHRFLARHRITRKKDPAPLRAGSSRHPEAA